MANLGPRDTTSLVMLTGWDATELQNFKLQDGTSYAEVVGDLTAGLTALNGELAGGMWGQLASFQDMPDVEYRVGSSNGMQRHTEYTRPDAQRAATEGHLIPLLDWDRGFGWTWDYLKKARGEQIEADIADGIKDARDKWRVQILTRLLQRGDDSVGTAGYSPGFATTAGSTSVDFVPPSSGGTSFANTHEHYVGIAGGVFTNAVFTDAKAELREHGHEGPYEFIIGPSDEVAVRALTDFYPVAASNVNYGSGVSLATLSGDADLAGGYYIGTHTDFNVRVVRGIPQYYGFGWKSYGNLSQRNPLRIRLDKGKMRPEMIVMTDPRAGNATTPIQYAMTYLEFGVGVADRTNGTARYVNNSTWADGTPT